MRILINASNLTKGGGVQVAVSFISELRTIEYNHFYYLLLSAEVASQLELEEFDNTRFKIVVLNPKKGILFRYISDRKLGKYEQFFKPDVIFSVFGPILWRPKAKHVVGFAQGHLLYPESPYFKLFSGKEVRLKRLRLKLRKYFFIKNSDFFITETADASERLSKILNINSNHIFTVSNTVNEVYLDLAKKNNISNNFIGGQFKLLSLSAYYTHKNLDILKKVIPFLEKLDQKITFYLTIDEENYRRVFKGYENWIVNLGPIPIKDCPKLYESMDAMILPTLLECFTASYPEAMCMKRPILTSDLSFARGICKDAALYFDPLDPKSIAEAIFKIKNDKKLYKNLVEKGNKIFAMTPSPQDRALSYLQIITQ